MHQNAFGGWAPPRPSGEFTALLQTPWLDAMGHTSKGKGGGMRPVSYSHFGGQKPLVKFVLKLTLLTYNLILFAQLRQAACHTLVCYDINQGICVYSTECVVWYSRPRSREHIF